MIDVLIPVAPYDYIPDRVIQAIDVSYRLITHISETESENPDRIDRITNARNYLRLQSTSEFVVCIDSDTILFPGAIRQAIDLLTQLDGGMVGIPTHPWDVNRPDHVKLKASVLLGDLTRQIPFRHTKWWCECLCFNLDLRLRGWNPIYLTTPHCCQVLDNRKRN